MSAGGAGGGGTRRGRRRAHRASAMSEINITPMVDVMLVLMVIFMVAAPMMVSGVPVKPPSTDARPLAPENDEQPLAVSLDAEGKIYLMNTEIAEADLIPRLQAVAAERTSKKVFVRADGTLSYERVMAIMGALSTAGFDEIGLVTDASGPKNDGSDGQ
ncbi:MAG: ExbD/TolR family protein [Deltaproteobacteria bacterium]